MHARTTDRRRAPTIEPRSLPRLLMLAGVVGAVLLAGAEFLPLLRTHLDSDRSVVASTSVGSAHSFALLPVALLALVFAVGFGRLGSRAALLGVGVLGALAMVIALSHDLPAADEHGLRIVGGHISSVANTVAYGFYAETFAALLLALTFVCGFLLIGPPARVPQRGTEPERRSVAGPSG
jgi:hypothetical protein